MTLAPIIRDFPATVDDVSSNDKTIIARVNANTLDRFNSVIDPKGVRLDNFRKNPICLWEHGNDIRRQGDPVGRCLWIRTDGGLNPTSILAKTRFLDDDFSRQRYEWLRDGVLNSFSIRAIPIEWGPPTREELRSRPELANDRPNETRGQFDGPLIYRVTDLAEYSVVSCGGNPDCLVVERAVALMGLVHSGKLWLPEEVRPMVEAKAKSISVPIDLPRTMTDSEGGLAGGGATVKPGIDGGPEKVDHSPVRWRDMDEDERESFVEERDGKFFAPCDRCMGGPHDSMAEAVRHACLMGDDEPERSAPPPIDRHVVEEHGKWYVLNHDRTKRLAGPYPSKKAADKRLGQIEYFKHAGRSAPDGDGKPPAEKATNPFGHCPHCGKPGVQRDEMDDGNDHCEGGHVYPSKAAVMPDEERATPGTPPIASASAPQGVARDGPVRFDGHGSWTVDGLAGMSFDDEAAALAMHRAASHRGPTLGSTIPAVLIEIRNHRDSVIAEIERERERRDLYERGIV